MEQVSTAGLRPEVRLQDMAPSRVSPHVTSPFHGVWHEWERGGVLSRATVC